MLERERNKTKNYINIDCSAMNSKATIELSSAILRLITDKYKDFDALVKITVKADND